MIGPAFFTFIGLYLWACYRITGWAKKRAVNKGLPGWKYALPVALLSYGLLFWDWIPTFATHQCLCLSEGGFTVNKSLEQWKQENPGVADTLSPIERPKWEHEGNITRVPMNQRFIWEFEDTQYWFGIHGRDERIVDTQTGEILARYVDFDSAMRNPIVGPKTRFRDYKLWLSWGTRSCERGRGGGIIVFREDENSYEWVGKGEPPNGYKFNKLKSQFKYID